MRGQTTLDFAIGVAIFMSAMLVTFAFVPGILEPFELTGDQDTIHSERIASQLSSDLLSDPESPYVLDRYCTVEFFTSGDEPECEFSGETVHQKLNLKPYQPINISLEGKLNGPDSEILCWDESNEAFGDPCDGSHTQLAVGGTPPENSDATVTSRRIVSLEHENVHLKVVLW